MTNVFSHQFPQTVSSSKTYAVRAVAVLFLFLIGMVSLSGAQAKTVYVSTSGSDATGCGTSTNPCASLAKAQLLVQGHPGSTVNVGGGIYYLPQSPTNPGTLNFTSSDSGSSGAVITWRAWAGTGTPIVSGGIPLTSSLGTLHNSGNLYSFQFNTNPTSFEYLFYTPSGSSEAQRRLRARAESNSSSSVGYYMSALNTCSTSNWPAAAGTPNPTLADCNFGTFLRVAATISPSSTSGSGCPYVINENNTSESKCIDRFQYDPNDTAVTQLVSGSSYTTNLNGTFVGGGTGPGFGGPNGNPAGPCTPTTGSQFPEGDIGLMLFDAWTVDDMRIACIDTRANFNVIYLTSATKADANNQHQIKLYNFFGSTVGHRYLIENARTAFFAAQAIGQTGIWYLDKSTTPGWTLYYVANNGENLAKDLITIPQLGVSFPSSTSDPVGGSLLSANGLSYVTFNGIVFEIDNHTPTATNFTTGVGGGFNNDDNGDSAVPQAIDCESCQFVTFNGITVKHTSATGLRVANAPSTVSCSATKPCVLIENSSFYDIGDDGIHIGHSINGSDNSSNVVQFVKATNNFIQGFSRVFPDGEGIAEGNGFNNTFSSNDVNDGYHAGISICHLSCTPVGVNGIGITTSLNHVRNINQGITADGGELYYNIGGSGGSGTGNVISNNLVHDDTDSSIIDNPFGSSPVHGSGYGGDGIYLDSQSADVLVEYNVVYNTSGNSVALTAGPAQISGWLPNTFKSNIFAYGRLSMFAEGQPWPQVMTVSQCPTNPTALQNINSNIFYFDLNDQSNLTNTLGFYVQEGCAYSCSAGASANYNQFQSFTNNLYWRTDGNFGTYNKAFHVYKTAPSNPSTCQSPSSTTQITNSWDFMPFSGSNSWQDGTYPTFPVNVTEDTGGLIEQPSFSASVGGGVCTSQVNNFCLAANPPHMTGFVFTQTNKTVTSAGSTLTAPATVPGTFATFIYSVANSF